MEIVLLATVIVGAPLFTLRFALCEALPHDPVVVTVTVCVPELNPVVFTLRFGLSPPVGLPSTVHASSTGPVPPAVVEKLAVAPSQTLWSAGSVVVVFACTVNVALWEAEPHVAVVVTETVRLP